VCGREALNITALYRLSNGSPTALQRLSNGSQVCDREAIVVGKPSKDLAAFLVCASVSVRECTCASVSVRECTCASV
jgi:hypothetical protein